MVQLMMVLNVKEGRRVPNRFVLFSLCIVSVEELLGALRDLSVKCLVLLLYHVGPHGAFPAFSFCGYGQCALYSLIPLRALTL